MKPQGKIEKLRNRLQVVENSLALLAAAMHDLEQAVDAAVKILKDEKGEC